MRKDLVDYKMDAREWEKAIDDFVIGKNAQRDKTILKLNLIYGYSYTYIAEKVDMSVRQVANIVPKRLVQLCDMLDYKRKFL